MSYIVLLLSVVVFFLGFYFFLTNIKKRRTTYCLAVTAGFEIIALMLVSAWFIVSGQRNLTPSFLVNILQFFSLDSSYEAVDASEIKVYSWLGYLINGYLFVIYSVAPILGGAFIYDILLGAAPRLKLILNRKKELFVFSELNEKTLALAKDIKRTNAAKIKKIALIFTDVYGEKSSEHFSELLQSAKAEGAICIQDDILHGTWMFRYAPKCSFFLADVNQLGELEEESNMIALDNLLMLLDEVESANTNRERHSKTKSNESNKQEYTAFFYSNSTYAVENISSIMEQYRSSKANDNNKINVRVIVVRDLARTAEILLIEHPLFEAINRNNKDNVDNTEKTLRVAIFGNTQLARELFKTVFWCGQMLNTRLCITVIYRPSGNHLNSSKTEFEEYLESVSPEIIESCRTPSQNYAPECLRIYGSETDSFDSANFAEPYAKLNFIETYLTPDNVAGVMNRGDAEDADNIPLYDYDYFFVANGADLENAKIASEIRKSILISKIGSKEIRGTSQRIAVAIQDDNIASITRKEFDNTKFRDETSIVFSNPNAPFVITFGSIEERFSWARAFLEFEKLIEYMNDPLKSQSEHDGAKSISERKAIYDSWAEEGQTAHKKYKYYSAISLMQYESKEQIIKELAWLEHRRWNAFIRAQGFSRPNVPQKYRNDKCCQTIPDILYKKSVENKLHACLVEADKSRMVRIKDVCHQDDLDPLDLINLIADDGRDRKKYDIEEAERVWISINEPNEIIEGIERYIRPAVHVKKNSRPVVAFQLGNGCSEEKDLIEKNKLKKLPDDQYEVFTRESGAVSGQKCDSGDYIKIDTAGYPYPVKKDVFEQMHTLYKGKWIQLSEVRSAWYCDLGSEDECEEMRFLLSNGKIEISKSSYDCYFSSNDQWETTLSAAKDAVIVFRNIERELNGSIISVNFSFVARDEFLRTYYLLD